MVHRDRQDRKRSKVKNRVLEGDKELKKYRRHPETKIYARKKKKKRGIHKKKEKETLTH